MTLFNADVAKQYEAQQTLEASVKKYYFSNGQVNSFDSINTNKQDLPSPLVDIFDSIGQDQAGQIDKAIRLGIETYQARNGGELPHPSLIASALCAGSQAAQEASLHVNSFDSISAQNYEQASVVPAVTVVTIASIIGTALPMVAMLPNPSKSVLVPIVAVRHTTNSSFGAMNEGEFLDGPNAAKPYAEGRFCFEMAKGSGNTFAVTAHTKYLNFAAKTPDTTAPKLPFLGANVSIRVNGIEVATSVSLREASVQRGQVSPSIKQKGVTIAGVNYKPTSAVIDLDQRSVQVTFNAALPTSAKVQVFLVADFDAKQNNQFILTPVGTSVHTQYEYIQSVPIPVQVKVSNNVVSQLANELGLGFVGSALANIQSKIFLEQNVRLLSESKDRALYSGRFKTFDASRGVTGQLASVTNTTGDLFAEIIPHISSAKQQINLASGNSTTSFALYVGDNGATFFNTLSADRFTKTGASATYNEIVRIGTLSDGTHVYHTPTKQGVVTEESVNNVVTLDMLLLGSGNEPARNPLVGTITQPPVITEAKGDPRETVFGLSSQMAAEQNPNDRYAEQSVVIQAINLKAL